ncbi:hypothetical protein FXB41_28760 [Bradyrhizobium canariense]|uniref:hypothetical protein n=1 Tax=Bradyrhizobium canariense TaxID=255045 RepID=UPI001CA588CD|nr:hypothetical protein [Bradyrhizobium canariense]MBW5438610.1 hypothetical protein [Bradyrhizobium canariense]
MAGFLALVAPVHAQNTKAQINTQITTNFPDNTVGQITPQGLRAVTSNIVNSIMPTAPVTSGNLPCFSGTTGLLQDCGFKPAQPLACSSSNWFRTLSTDGTLGCSQPAFSDLSGNISVSQMNGGTNASPSTFWRGDGTWAAPSPAFSDLSGNISVSQMNGGTNASPSTFWRGDGTWAAPSGGSGGLLNLLPNTQWQIIDAMPVITKMNLQGTGTQAGVSVTSYSAAGVYNTLGTANTQQMQNGDLVTVTANADPVLTRAPMHVTNLVANTSFGLLSPFQGAVGATSTATVTPISRGDITGSTTVGPLGWTKSSSMILWRDSFAANAKAGSQYTLGMRKGSSSTESLTYTAPAGDFSQFKGRNIVCGGWVLSKLNVGNGQWKFAIRDGTQTVFSSTNSGAYTWAEVTATISASATTFAFDLQEIGSSGDGYYLSQPICAYGTSLGTGNYIQNPGEHVNFKNHPGLIALVPLTQTFPSSTFAVGALTSTLYGWEVNIEAVTQGAIVGTVKNVNMQVEFVSPTAGKQAFTTPCIGIGGLLTFGSELNTPAANITVASNSLLALDDGSCYDVTTAIGGTPEPGYFAIWTAASGMTYTNLTYDFYGATLR